jgi:hypothetical protein
LDAIEQLIIEERGGDRTEKNNFSVLLRNGIVPEELKGRYGKAFKKHQQAWSGSGNKQGLSFSDLTRFNTWFELHPEKVAGVETITTSREFPISIKGTKEDILDTVAKTLRKKNTTSPQRDATLVPDLHRGYGYTIRMVDGRPFQGSYTDTFAWYRLKRDGIKAVNANPKLRYVPLKKVKPFNGKSRFSFTASNITVYDNATNKILAQSMHDSKNLLRLLKKFPNFVDRESIRRRLRDYYMDIPQKEKDAVFQDSGKRVRIIRAKAEAKLKLLNLLKI